LIYRIVGGVFIESFYVAFFKKRPLIQRAQRWSRLARRETFFWRFSFVSFSFAPTASKEKRKAV